MSAKCQKRTLAVLSGAPELIQARASNSDKSFHPLVDYITVIRQRI
jgi:hypothetical protein